jgi:hypothetical protein
MPRRLLIAGLIVAALGIAAAILWPIIEQAQMEAPLAQAVTGVQRGKVEAIAACFTPDAAAVAGEVRVPIARLLKYAGPALRDGDTALRFSGMTLLRRTHATAEVEFGVIFYVYDDVGRRLPIPRKGKARLARTGWLAWRIAEVSTDDPHFAAALAGALRD